MTITVLPRSGRRAYPPRRTEVTHHFWDGLTAGRFETTQCEACGALSFPPKAFCPHCWCKRVRWRELDGAGVIYSHTTVHAAPEVLAHEAPYRLCITDLDVGLRIATRLVDVPRPPQVGDRVELVALLYEDGPLFAVRPVPAGA